MVNCRCFKNQFEQYSFESHSELMQYLLPVCMCVYVYVLPPQGLLLSRIMPKTCIRMQVSDAWRTSLQCLFQFPSSPFLNLSYFTFKDETPAHCISTKFSDGYRRPFFITSKLSSKSVYKI